MPDALPIFKYDSNYNGPPVPVIKLKISNPGTQSITEDIFLVDCGADMTSIKKEIFDILDLHYSSYTTVSSATGQEDKRFIAIVQIQTPFGFNEPIEVIIEPKTNENLLGRDLINKWKVLLDGPKQQMTIEI